MRQSLMLSDGDFSIFVTPPISGVVLAIFFIVLIGNVVQQYRRPGKTRSVFDLCMQMK
jgi:TctA family transporter